MPAELSIFNHRILRVLRLVSRGHRKFTKISISETIYVECFRYFIITAFVSEDIVELSNSMENFVVFSVEGNNTEMVSFNILSLPCAAFFIYIC